MSFVTFAKWYEQITHSQNPASGLWEHHPHPANMYLLENNGLQGVGITGEGGGVITNYSGEPG